MASTIQLDVKVNKAQATADIQAVAQAADAVAKSPHVISFSVKGAEVIIKEAKSATTAQHEAEAATQRRITAEKNLEAAATRRATAEINAASKSEQAQERAALQTQRHSDKMEELAARTNQATSASNALSVALGSIAARGFHLVVSKITQGIREAITEMKDVDTQLTNISKVSGITGQALEDMGERAYETASKYGVAADEYLSAVYTFQKAGLGESAEAMGELAVKTMLVGDTTADVASQFLISANAAWKFGGNIEDLNRIVDEADYINNNYATDLTKLSQGLPRVASVAAQAGMSAEETLAAIGTITAVTQESGTKAATALRALILNIEGQVGEFVDETGETFTVTEESVKSMEGLMNKYAKAELDAAKASGELINPMTAIKAIFEGMANSDLNNQELFDLLSGMGGKLRTNQLTALVQNYKLFDDMLGKIANSAGTADSEIALMMESWERKTQVLKNTWTEFIADIVSTDFMKDTIDSLTAIVDAMDGLVERTDNPWYESDKTNQEIQSTEDKIAELQKAILEFTWEGPNAEQNLHDLEVELQIQQEILETKKKQYQLEHEEETKKLQKELTRGYLNLDGSYTRVDIEELSSLGERLGKVDFLGNIKDYQANLKTILSDFSDYYDKVQQVKDAGGELTAEQEQFLKNYELANNFAEQQGLHVGELVDGYWQLTDSTGKVVAQVKDITSEQEEQQKNLDNQLSGETYWEKLGQDLAAYKDGASEATSETEGIASAVKTISFAEAIAGALKLAAALGQAEANAAAISVGGVGAFGHASGTTNAPGGKTLVNELGPELISENGKAYIANNGKPAVVNLSKGAIVLPANVTRQALKGGPTKTINAAANGTDYGTGLTILDGTEGGSSGSRQAHHREESIAEGTADVYGGGKWKCPTCGTINAKNAKKCVKCGYVKSTTTRGGGGSSKKKKSKKEKAQEAADELTTKLTNLDNRADLAKLDGRYDDAKSLYNKAISLIKKQIKVYQKAGYKDTSNEIVELKKKIYAYQDKIDSVNETQWNADIDAREAEINARRNAKKQQDKEDAVEKARVALENAKNQRNVRMFNAATGRWEWVADQGAIDSAQASYDSAKESLLEWEEDQELSALRARRDAGETYGTAVTGTGDIIARLLDGSTGEIGGAFGVITGGTGWATEEVGTIRSTATTTDSHDIIYSFGSITMTEGEAESTTVAELAKKLSVLKIS